LQFLSDSSIGTITANLLPLPSIEAIVAMKEPGPAAIYHDVILPDAQMILQKTSVLNVRRGIA
jgi:hypothetical protein